MKLYVIRGEQGSGKTTLMRRFAVAFDAISGATINCDFEGFSLKSITKVKQRLVAEQQAILSGRKPRVLEMAAIIEVRQLRIGLYTKGDFISLMEEAVRFFNDNKCDIGIMAAHNTYNHNGYFLELMCQGFIVEIVDCYPPKKTAKDYTDQDIDDLIRRVVKKKSSGKQKMFYLS